MIRWRGVALPTALGMLLWGAAQSRADPGEVSEYDGGEIRLNVGINFTENQLVSGTKVEVLAGGQMGADAGDSPDEPTEPVYARRKGYRLEIGGTVVASGGSLAEAGGGGGAGGSGGSGLPGGVSIDPPIKVRIASTHFGDGTDIVIKMTVEFNRQSRATYSSMNPGAVWDLPTRTVVATRTIKAYNRVLAWKTKVTADGVTPWSAANSAIIDGVVAAGRSAYLSAKYGDVPVPVTTGPKPTGTDLITWQQVINDRAFDGKATALFGMTHGFGSAIEGSYGGNNIPFIPDLASSPAWAHVAHPLGYHINVFYSCETMVTSHADSMPHQHGSPPPGQWIAAGRVGFRVTVYPMMLNNDGSPTHKSLAQHAEKFFQALNEGYTLDKARRIANLFVFGRETELTSFAHSQSATLLLSPVFNQPHADPYATLRYVYLGPGERPDINTPDIRWYYVHP